MKQVLPYPDEFIQATGKSPSVCLVLPFEPQLNDKKNIDCRLKSLLAKAESRLLQQYSTRKAIPVLARLQQLIAGINYYYYKKSMALLSSAEESKIFYLDFPVMETVRIGESLDVRDVVRAKSKSQHYLVLVLGADFSNLYQGNCTGLSLIKHNAEDGNQFLQHIDQGLGFILDAYPLPVFVLGQREVVEAFQQLTAHAEQIVGYLPGNFNTSTETAILMTLQPELHHWNKNKRQLLLQKLHKARQEGKLSSGVKEVWNAATHRRSLLLVVEENYMQELVDDIMEKVLKDGGDVEFVETGTLDSFQQIALIEYHTN